MTNWREHWNRRYSASELVWGAEPNRFVAEAFANREPRGRALDLACGEGRNAIWLAERGWRVCAVDFSDVAVERGRGLAAQRGIELDWRVADVTSWQPEPGAYALVLLLYLQLPPDERRAVLAHAARALAPGGELFAVGHALRNLREGSGGPQSAEVLWDPDELARELRALGLDVVESAEVLRPVEGADRPAIDVRTRARART